MRTPHYNPTRHSLNYHQILFMLPLSSVAFGLIPILIALGASIITWRRIKSRFLFFVIALLISFGLRHFTSFAAAIYQAILWRTQAPFYEYASIYGYQEGITIIAQITVTPIILWRLYLLMHQTKQKHDA